MTLLGPLAVAKLIEYSDWPTPEWLGQHGDFLPFHSWKVKRGRAPQKHQTKEGRGDQSKRRLYCTRDR